MTGGRGRRATTAVAFLVALIAAGCAGSTRATAPPIPAATAPSISAAAELAVAELPPLFDPPVSASPAATTDPAVSAVPAVTLPATVGSVEPATTVPAVDDGGDARAHDALALIAFPWRRTLPNWSVNFLPARAGLRGLTRVDERRIEIYVRDSDTPATLARIVAHELGHAVDVQLNSPSDRERWRVLRGAGPTVAWWPGNSASDFDTLAGDFAEAFASWLTGSVSESRVAPQPGPAEFAVLAALVSNR